MTAPPSRNVGCLYLGEQLEDASPATGSSTPARPSCAVSENVAAHLLGRFDDSTSVSPGCVSTAGWIWLENLQPFLAFLSGCSGAASSKTASAIQAGLPTTDVELGKWLECEWAGVRKVWLSLALHRDGSVVDFRLECDRQTAAQVETAVALMSKYILRQIA